MSDERNHGPDRDENTEIAAQADVEEETVDDDGDETSEEEISEADIADWGGGELEAAYLRAMSALDASDFALPPIHQTNDSVEVEAAQETPAEDSATSRDDLQTPAAAVFAESSGEQLVTKGIADTEIASTVSTDVDTIDVAAAPDLPMTPRQIIEACLFVGGDALTSKRLAGVLRGDLNADFIDREINELNRLYAAENRPYEIRLAEGGYRLALRDEYERIRHKVYGLGPKEVRLSQEALEVLAVVAYHQPMNQSRVEELGKPGCGAVLRQLVRRELLAVERDPEHPRDVHYITTPRFLSLFGISHLDELPRHEQVSYK